MKDVDAWLESTRYSALDASSDLSFTFCRLPPAPVPLWYRVPHFPPVTFTRSTSKSRMCVHSYSSCSVVEFTASPSTSHFLEPRERFASKSDVFAGDQNIFPPSRAFEIIRCIMQGIGKKRGREGEEFSIIGDE